MDYGLMPIYVVSFVNFSIAHEDEAILQDGLISRYGICSPETGEVMTESLQFVYLELDRLEAKLEEAGKCRSLVEQLAYSLKYMRELDECPKAFENQLFSLLFLASEYANLDVSKQMQVSEIMRTELDKIAENNYAREQGLQQGRAEGKAEGRYSEVPCFWIISGGHSQGVGNVYRGCFGHTIGERRINSERLPGGQPLLLL